MNFCAYNVRGVNKKISFAQDFIRDNNIGLIALLETHVKQASATFVSKSIRPDFCWYFNYPHHHNGHIWVGWNPALWSIVPLVTDAQHITCGVTNLSTNEHFLVSFVYALNSAVERKNLWASLVSFHDSVLVNGICPPWIALGDFNVCLNVNEISGGKTVVTSGMTDFRDCLNAISMVDLHYSGQFLTWWDKGKILKKLDRALVNPSWLDCFRNSYARFLPRGLSDHCPVVATTGTVPEKISRPFQVFKHIIEDSSFLHVVTEAWNSSVFGDPWYVLSTKLKRVKSALIALNRSRGDLHIAVCKAKANLHLLQDSMPSQPNDNYILEEARLCSSLKDALLKEETFLKQKARVRWLNLGDGNNKYFYNACRGRWNTNKIVSLEDESGNVFYTHKAISGVAVNYFENLLGKHVTTGPIAADISIPCLEDCHRRLLMINFSEKEGDEPQEIPAEVPSNTIGTNPTVEKDKAIPAAAPMSKPVYPPPPFPRRLKKQQLDKQFGKFLEVFKKLHINIPFAEALEQMPSYAKFMKGILSKKLKLEELETVALTEECSAVRKRKNF
ncbi:uncharacterized protein LOC108204038 [Daucus carota subsp. sativus]|uniref:uncharacterized protein LOC108204038 n=1 Tax=Daucus carota subsp. sativus TaxID=79200 RepID=UPI003082AEAE